MENHVDYVQNDKILLCLCRWPKLTGRSAHSMAYSACWVWPGRILPTSFIHFLPCSLPLLLCVIVRCDEKWIRIRHLLGVWRVKLLDFFLHCMVSNNVGTYFRTPTEFNFTFSPVLLGVFLAMFKFAIPFDLWCPEGRQCQLLLVYVL